MLPLLLLMLVTMMMMMMMMMEMRRVLSVTDATVTQRTRSHPTEHQQ